MNLLITGASKGIGLATAKMLADHDVTWFEEALPPDDLEGHVLLREHSPVPIAGGEVLTRDRERRGYRRG